MPETQRNIKMDVILIHGMGRTPVSMLLLHRRLMKLDHSPHLFGYSPTFESLDHVTKRLVNLIRHKVGQNPYALVGHSLGSVIIRNALPQLATHEPETCFFLAPPMVVCKAARSLSRVWPLRLLGGEMGQLLAQEAFMNQLEMLDNTQIYAGIRGPRARWLPFGHELNDCVLTLEEASGGATVEVVEVPSIHPFIMNSPVVIKDMANALATVA